MLRAVGVGLASLSLILGGALPAHAALKIKVRCTNWINVYDSAALQVRICENATVDTVANRTTMGATYYARWNSVGTGDVDIYWKSIDFAPAAGSIYCDPPRFFNPESYRFRNMQRGKEYRIVGGQPTIVAHKHIRGTSRCTTKWYHPQHGSVGTSALAAMPDVGNPRYIRTGYMAFG